jgi:hypothetical protein
MTQSQAARVFAPGDDAMAQSMSARVLTHGDYSIRYLPVASATTPRERDELALSIDLLTDQIWEKDPWQFRKIPDMLFSDDDGLMVISIGGSARSIAGFLSFRRLRFDGTRAVFLNFINILHAHHGKGLYAALARELIRDHQIWAGDRPLFYCWRTRNPVMWFANARLCTRITPDLLDGEVDLELRALAARAAQTAYPHNALDPVTFAIPDSYPDGHAYKRPQHHSQKHLDEQFYGHPAVARLNSTLFGFGELKPLGQGSFAGS